MSGFESVNVWFACAGTCALFLGAFAPARKPRARGLSQTVHVVDASALSCEPVQRHRAPITVRLARIVASTLRGRRRTDDIDASVSPRAAETASHATDQDAEIPREMFEPLDATDTEEMRPANLDAGPPPSAPIGHGNRWAAPLTRRRLRSSDNAITWPQSFDADSPVLDERARCALLERLLSADENPDILALAYRQENVAARTLITRGLSAQPPAAQRKVFQTMYAVGNDAERATAIDAFIKLGASDDLIAAFQDRRESLAARAAYAFGKTHCRAEFHARLASLCEPARLEAIVTLLSGVLS